MRLGAETRNAMNEVTSEFEEFGKFWSARLTQKPTEGWKAGQTAAQVERLFNLRYTTRTASISPSDRLICDGNTYEIIGVTEHGRQHGIDIVAIAYTERGLNNES